MNIYLWATLAFVAGLGVGVGALLLFGCGSTAVTGKPFDPASPTFPQVTGNNLNGRHFEIPSQLDAPFNILMVAFYRGQQDDVNTWLDTASELVADHANVEYYELPTINSGWGLVRNWIAGVCAAAYRTSSPAIGRSRCTPIQRSSGNWPALTRPTRYGWVWWTVRGESTGPREVGRPRIRFAPCVKP